MKTKTFVEQARIKFDSCKGLTDKELDALIEYYTRLSETLYEIHDPHYMLVINDCNSRLYVLKSFKWNREH